jgi:hypothetical protein
VLDDINFIINERYGGTIEGEAIFEDDPSALESIGENVDLPLITMRPYVALMALGGLLLAAYRRDWVVLATVGAFWVVFTLSLLPAVRPRLTYWLPTIVPTVILAGYLAAVLIEKRNRLAMLGALVLVACLIWGITESARLNLALSRENTRLLAYDFVTQTIPEQSRILIGDTFIYSVPLDRSSDSRQRMQAITEIPPSHEHFLAFPEDAPQPQYDLFGNEYRAELTSAAAWRAFLTENDIEYVIEADYCNPADPLEATLPDALRDDLTLIYEVSPFASSECETHIENRTHMEYMRLDKWQRVGPIIRIYAR